MPNFSKTEIAACFEIKYRFKEHDTHADVVNVTKIDIKLTQPRLLSFEPTEPQEDFSPAGHRPNGTGQMNQRTQWN